MKKALYLSAVLTAVIGFGAIYSQSAPKAQAAQRTDDAVLRCTVNDPTGTMLNVRDRPNGNKVLSTLQNGTRVSYTTESGDGHDRSWAFIQLDKKDSKPLGWALREYLECE